MDWARARVGTGHKLGTCTGTDGLGTGWARAGHGRAGHKRIVSERHGYPLVVIMGDFNINMFDQNST